MLTRAVLVITLAFSASAVNAFCSDPDAPYCAERYGAFDDEDDFRRCKREMEWYRSEIESFLGCLKRESDNAVSEYDDAVTSFNRRARGN